MKVVALTVFPKYDALGYHFPGDAFTIDDNTAKELIDNGFAELFTEEAPETKEEKVKKTTKEDKTKLQTKEVKVLDSKVEE